MIRTLKIEPRSSGLRFKDLSEGEYFVRNEDPQKTILKKLPKNSTSVGTVVIHSVNAIEMRGLTETDLAPCINDDAMVTRVKIKAATEQTAKKLDDLCIGEFFTYHGTLYRVASRGPHKQTDVLSRLCIFQETGEVCDLDVNLEVEPVKETMYIGAFDFSLLKGETTWDSVGGQVAGPPSKVCAPLDQTTHERNMCAAIKDLVTLVGKATAATGYKIIDHSGMSHFAFCGLMSAARRAAVCADERNYPLVFILADLIEMIDKHLDTTKTKNELCGLMVGDIYILRAARRVLEAAQEAGAK
jgi:hypothetical protein